MITLTLPLPPTWNHCYGQHGARKYLKPAGREYRQQVAEIVAEADQFAECMKRLLAEAAEAEAKQREGV